MTPAIRRFQTRIALIVASYPVVLAAQNTRADECEGQPNYSVCIDDGIPCTIDECRSESCIHRYDRVIYVRSRCETPVGDPFDGCSWSNAFETIQAARAVTDDYTDTVEEIWVANGVYKAVNVCGTNNCVSTGTCVPGSTERSNSFDLKNTVEIYGGFRGTEVVRAERPTDSDPYTIDPLTDSVLTGDLNGDDPITTQADCESLLLDGAWYNGKCIEDDNDVTTQLGCVQLGGIWVNGQRCIYDYSPVLTRRFENSSHVVRASGTDLTARLDGFTVTGGNDDGSGDYDGGGGIRLDDNSRATIWNCAILSNYAAGGGGGIYCPGDEGDPFASFIVDCVIAQNVASHGGGIGGKGVSSHRIFNCEIVSNLSYGQGGGIFLSEGRGDPLIVNTLIAGNTDTIAGGGIYATVTQTTLTLTNCTLVNNYAPSGGAIRAHSGVVVLVHNSIIWGNTADFGASIDAGSIFFQNRGAVVVRYSDVHRRRVCSNNSQPCLSPKDCASNVYCVDPPAGLCVGGSNPGAGCANSSNCSGGTCSLGSDVYDPGNFTSTLRVDTDACVGGTRNGLPCTRTQNCPGGVCGVFQGNLLNSNPLFVDPPSSASDASFDLSLQPSSLCMDAGDNTRVPPDVVDLDNDINKVEKTPLDLRLQPRFVDGPAAETGVGDTPYFSPLIVDMGAYEFVDCLVISEPRFDCNDNGELSRNADSFTLPWRGGRHDRT